jgi:outer membrane protein OmpA-like peptidoglycan-associated protein
MTPALTARRGRALAGVAVALWLAGCAAPPPVAPPSPATIHAPTVASGGVPARAPGAVTYVWSDKLAASAQKLRGGLQGNDVAVSQTTDQRLWVSLPADAAFAVGRSAVKAPASGWLDQVALALRDLPRTEVQIVSDADATGSARALALERAASARDWLVGRGVPPQRISVAGRGSHSPVPADQRRLDILVGERGAK